MRFWLIAVGLLIGAFAVDYLAYDDLYFNSVLRLAQELVLFFG